MNQIKTINFLKGALQVSLAEIAAAPHGSARKIDVGKQRPRPRIRSAHGKPLEVEPERNHIRECLSAGEKFNSLLDCANFLHLGTEMLQQVLDAVAQRGRGARAAGA